MITLVPAYGRDYSSQKEVKKAFHIDNDDFQIKSINSKWDRSYANKRDLKATDHNLVKVRYNDLRDSVYVKIERDRLEELVDPKPEDNTRDVGEKLSTEETLERSGFSDLNEIMKENMTGTMIGVPAMCSEGCKVEMDGMCPHGNPSILRGNALV